MKKINKSVIGLALVFTVLVIIQTYFFFTPINYNNFVLKGEVSTCTTDCFDHIRVRNVTAGGDFIIWDDKSFEDYNYSGLVVPQICEDIIISERCVDLDITKIPEYRLITRKIVDTDKTFANFSYINKFVESPDNNKIYFLYRKLEETISNWVYDEPLVIISYDVNTKKVEMEGQLSVTGLNVKSMNISPRGSYILIVDSSNPRYLPNTTASNIVVYDLKNMTTKPFARVENGGVLDFLAWIDDSHFFYEEYVYGNGRDVTYRIGEIK